MASFAHHGICYPDQNLALQAVIADFPMSVAGNYYWVDISQLGVVGSSTTYVTAAGVAKLYLRAATSGSGQWTITLPACTKTEATAIFDKFSNQDITFSVSFILLFVLGVYFGHKMFS